MPELSRVVTFERAVIGLLTLSSVSLAAVVTVSPPSGLTRAPKAVLAVPPAVAERHPDKSQVQRPRHASRGAELTVGALSETFSNLNYDLDRLRQDGGAVPRLFMVALPVDMKKIRAPERRKNLFFKTVLPIVLRVNDEIRHQRRRLLDIAAQVKHGDKLAAHDRLWLAALAERYDTDRGDIDLLVRRVDTVPPSLALAQAAEESGWGTSRFAQEGNALFGQWTFSRSSGLVPKLRDDDKGHRIKRFETLLDATRAYTRNLNTHPAYKSFRQTRQSMRKGGQTLDGTALAGTMIRYSQRGKDYVRSLRQIISVNRLESFDGARLGDPIPSAITTKPLI